MRELESADEVDSIGALPRMSAGPKPGARARTNNQGTWRDEKMIVVMKPSTTKGTYIRKVVLSATMSPSVMVQI